MRKSFHQRLKEITEDVIDMGKLSREAVNSSVRSFIGLDSGLAQEVIDMDGKIDDYDISIEEKCIVLQAEHQPVAKDLRLLHSISMIIKHIERIGDLAVNIAKIAKKLSKEEKKTIDKKIIKLVKEMGDLVLPEMDMAIEAFRKMDKKEAHRLGKSDDAIDKIQKQILKELFTSNKGEKDIRFVTNITLVSRYLERIGDQSVNIGERTLYLLTGDYSVFHNN